MTYSARQRKLIVRLSSADAETRQRAAEALGESLIGKSCPRRLIRSLEDPDELVRVSAAEALGFIGDKHALSDLKRCLEDGSPLVRSYVASAIGQLGGITELQMLKERMRNDQSIIARIGYLDAMYAMGRREVLADLIRLFRSKRYRIRCAVANTFASMRLAPEDVPSALAALLEARSTESTVAALSSISGALKVFKRTYGKPKNTR